MNEVEWYELTDFDYYRLRAVKLDEVTVDGEKRTDIYIWFFGMPEDDLWLAHGLTDDMHDGITAAMEESFEKRDKRLWTALAQLFGQDWELVLMFTEPVADLQRVMITGMSDSEKEELKLLSKDQIEARRKAEEITSNIRQNWN